MLHAARVFLKQHHFCGSATNFHRKVRAAIPWIHLAHAGKKQTWYGRRNRRDISGMVWQRDRLGIGCLGDPNFIYPIPIEVRIDLYQVRQELIRQFVIAFVEIRVVGFEVVANIEDVITAEVLRLEEVGVFDQREEG